MTLDIASFHTELKSKLDVLDLKGAAADCEKLTAFLIGSNDEIALPTAEKILQQLRSKRMFGQMQRLADTLLSTGRTSFRIRRQYAQSMIDLGNYTAAISILESLIQYTEKASPVDGSAFNENKEARGLIGRAYKQLYVNAASPANPQCALYLSLSLKAYHGVYEQHPDMVWHGINAAALVIRAKKDGIEWPDMPDAKQIAAAILKLVEEKYANEKADAWDFATAAEACILLNKPEEALKWLSGYARMPYCDAFELASTLRQFEEVWRLSLDEPIGQLLLPILRAELAARQGGNVTLDMETIKKQKAIENLTTQRYNALIEPTTDAGKPILEKVFGDESFKTYKWYMTGADRCLAVARVGRDATKGKGTGFLVKGKMLRADWGEELLILTNAHVVSNDPLEKALKPEEVIVTFEALDRDQEFRNMTLRWSSPSTELDAAVLCFDPDAQQRLTALTSVIKFYPVSPYLPPVETPPSQKIYIIGHPGGGTLQLSFLDNLLIDHEAPRIHYRTPTEGGSSGSPLFNQQWDLIGLHHAGSEEMPCLNNKPGTYEANEGIWIQCVITTLATAKI